MGCWEMIDEHNDHRRLDELHAEISRLRAARYYNAEYVRMARIAAADSLRYRLVDAIKAADLSVPVVDRVLSIIENTPNIEDKA